MTHEIRRLPALDPRRKSNKFSRSHLPPRQPSRYCSHNTTPLIPILSKVSTLGDPSSITLGLITSNNSPLLLCLGPSPTTVQHMGHNRHSLARTLHTGPLLALPYNVQAVNTAAVPQAFPQA